MISPFQVHADLTAKAQAFLGGQSSSGDRKQVATITIYGVVVPCTHSPIVRNWILDAGKSSQTAVEHCTFLVSDLPANVPNTNPAKSMTSVLEKGVPCLLNINPKLPGIKMMLWTGGLQTGGLIFDFMLVGDSHAA